MTDSPAVRIRAGLDSMDLNEFTALLVALVIEGHHALTIEAEAMRQLEASPAALQRFWLERCDVCD